MRRNDIKLLIDVVLLASAFVSFASGIVLFFHFHVGEGALRESALGITRLAWLNLHRLPALLVGASLTAHVTLNWKAFVGLLRRGFSRRHSSELILYVTFLTVTITGFVAWFVVGGSRPLAGRVLLEPLSRARHQLVDVHNIVGLLALIFAAHHVGHRWSQTTRGVRLVWSFLFRFAHKEVRNSE